MPLYDGQPFGGTPLGDEDGGGSGGVIGYHTITRPIRIIAAHLARLIRIDTRDHFVLGKLIRIIRTQALNISKAIRIPERVLTLSKLVRINFGYDRAALAKTIRFPGPLHAAANAASLRWGIVAILDGVDVSARIVGACRCGRAEDASATIELQYAPPAGALDPLLWVSRPLVVRWQLKDSAGAVTTTKTRFVGKVAEVTWDAAAGVLTLVGSTDLQGVFDHLSDAQIDASVPGLWSDAVFSTDSHGWQRALDRLSTTEEHVWHDEQGQILYTGLRAKVSPDFSFSASRVIVGSISVDHAARMDMVNRIMLRLDYRFERRRERRMWFSWETQHGACEFLLKPYTLCQRSMVESAATGAGGWVLQGEIRYVPVWRPGVYQCGARHPIVWGYTEVLNRNADGSATPIVPAQQDLSPFCIGASWRAARRWLQTVTEQYTLQVQCSDSIAAVGPLQREEEYGLESEADNSAWESSLERSGPEAGSRQIGFNFGDFAKEATDDDAGGRDSLAGAIECALSAARVDLLQAHRLNRVRFTVPYQPALSLAHTVAVSASGIAAQGKVCELADTLDVGSGEATTEVILAISRHDGQGLVTDTPLTTPEPPEPPAGPVVPQYIRMRTYIGGLLTSPPQPEDEGGYFTNYQWDPDAVPDWSVNPSNPAVHVYDQAFRVVPPDIEAEAADATEAQATQVYEVAIPQDTLTITR